jgi:hypothetical protein
VADGQTVRSGGLTVKGGGVRKILRPWTPHLGGTPDGPG